MPLKRITGKIFVNNQIIVLCIIDYLSFFKIKFCVNILIRKNEFYHLSLQNNDRSRKIIKI